MQEVTFWKDEVVEYANRYRETNVGGGQVDLTRVTGEVVQQGTPQSATNFNKLERNAAQGSFLGLIMGQAVNQLCQKVDGLDGEQIEITLTNSQTYPFNNSKTTVQLSKSRNTKDYSVTVEILEKTGGGAGDIVISDKLLNGFKIAFTGAASSVKVNCIIRGGI